jgi:hypothetical protein
MKSSGICVYGKPADEVFAEVLREHYLDSIALDSEDNFENIRGGTVPWSSPE